MLKVTSLFSGIGGIDLGLEATGYFKTTLFSEIDPFCQKILKKHWPNVPIIPNVKDINGKEIETDVLVGGFPCQPFSVAGKRKGKEDERHLWPEMFRIIKEARPSIVIGENVPGIINTQMALGQCVSDLESEGYKVQPVVLPACSVNAPHRRYRVFIIAMVDTDNLRLEQYNETQKEEQIRWAETPSLSRSENVANPNSSSFTSWESRGADREVSSESERLRGGKSQRETGKEFGSSSKNVANSNSFGHRGWNSQGCSSGGETRILPGEQEGRETWSETERCSESYRNDVANSESVISDGGRYRDYSKKEEISGKIRGKSSILSNPTASGSQTSPEECFEQKGTEEADAIAPYSGTIGDFNPRDNWSVEPNVGRVAHGISDRVDRIKSLGNAVVPQLTYIIGMSIIRALQND